MLGIQAVSPALSAAAISARTESGTRRPLPRPVAAGVALDANGLLVAALAALYPLRHAHLYGRWAIIARAMRRAHAAGIVNAASGSASCAGSSLARVAVQ
jgi:hypothetical protein